MSSLSELLERRRAASGAPSAACHQAESQPACLIVTTNAGESWVFPWTHLAAAHFSRNDEREDLRLVFTSHEVRLSGMNLAAVRDHIATLQLARLRPAPAKHKPNDSEPFLEAIHVSPHRSPSGKAGA